MSGQPFDPVASDRLARAQERAQVQVPAGRLEQLHQQPVVLRFRAPTTPVSMNELGRGRGRLAYGKAAPWKAVGTWLVQDFREETVRRLARPRPITVHLELPFPTARTRDPVNYVVVQKAVVDGIVQRARWVPDDNPEWVTDTIPTLVVDPAMIATLTITDRG